MERRPEHDKRLRVYSLEPQPLLELADWLTELSQSWQSQLDSFKESASVKRAHDRRGNR
jgi:hypothetical protein